jgi:threonine aldolase
MGHLAHTFLYEAGGISALGGVHPRTIPNQEDGTLRLEDIQSAVRSDDIHFPPSKLLILENTHNKCGGVSISREKMLEMAGVAQKNVLAIHLDGARIFNAAVDQSLPAEQLTNMVDSVTFCLSKGLCAPAGSVLCGTKAFIEQARRIRKQLGGGMRQVGVLAAAGIVALEEMVDRLIEDHQHAHELAAGLSSIEGINLDKGSPNTNMVYIALDSNLNISTQQCAEMLRDHGILAGVTGPRHFRLVCHYWIHSEDIPKILSGFKAALAEC